MIHYQLTEKEVVRGLLKYRRSLWRRWALIALGVMGAALVVFNHLPQRPEAEGGGYMGYLFIGVAVFAAVLRPLTLRYAFAKVVRNNAVFTEPKDVSFDEKAILVCSPVQKAEIMWSYFKKLTEDDQYYYLHSDHLGNVTLLPKSAFDEAHRQEFLARSQSIPRA